MEAVLDRPANTIQRKKPAATPKASSVFGSFNIKHKIDNHKLARAWYERNLDHAEVFANSLELEYIIFQQNLFIEDSKELSAKLSRIGFVEQNGFPDEELFKDFVRVMYNKKYNIAISLFQPTHKDAIYTSYKIVEKSIVDGQTGLAVFLASVEILLNK